MKNYQTKILSVDGGGMRGVIPSTWLETIDLYSVDGISKNFDLVVGTSTGSIVACAVAADVPPVMLYEFYRKNGPKIFPTFWKRIWSKIGRIFSQGLSSPKYDNQELKNVLYNVFGNKTLGELSIPTMITAYSLNSKKIKVFKSFKAEDKDIKVVDAILASCAAPTYFPAYKIKGEYLIDGGVAANNPSMVAISEALRNDEKDLFVLSLGTGDESLGIRQSKSTKMGLLEWILPLFKILFDGSEKANEYYSKNVVKEENFMRWQFKLPKTLGKMDDTKQKNLLTMRVMAKDYLFREKKDDFTRLVKILNNNSDLTQDES